MAGSRLTALSFAKDAAQAAAADLLVVIFLRGGMDGLNFVAPVNDPTQHRRHERVWPPAQEQ
jgi:uncharacterized protein (DUF1501 family)